jgi:uncharacterized protein YjiS (DUF1127 family)
VKKNGALIWDRADADSKRSNKIGPQEIAPSVAKGRVIVAHLGSGASMCALAAGNSIESTMGFTALDGLPMGTRSGQIDRGALLKGWALKLWHRIGSRCQLESLSERDLADMGMTRTDAFNEIQKPFWQQ